MTLPSLFLSHGAPTLPLTDTPARAFLSQLGHELPRPKAILIASAHWETERATANAVAWNETIHDFYGFPRALYELRYPAPGAPGLAHAIAGRLQAAGIACDIDDTRGLDHGAWVPLSLIYPAADIPVLQLSVQTHLGPEHHLRLGRALAPLRDEGVLIIGSGSFTHDLSEFRGHGPNDPAPDWVNGFADWFDAALTEERFADLIELSPPCALMPPRTIRARSICCRSMSRSAPPARAPTRSACMPARPMACCVWMSMRSGRRCSPTATTGRRGKRWPRSGTPPPPPHRSTSPCRRRARPPSRTGSRR